MEIRNPHTNMVLHSELKEALAKVREKRAFDPQIWLEAKAVLLNDYMKNFGLKACVVAVSGGIDSAVVLGIAKTAQMYSDSPIEKIVPLMLPCFKNQGVSGQIDATNDGGKVCRHFGFNTDFSSYQVPVVDSQLLVSLGVRAFENQTGLRGNDWAQGQLVSYMRTPLIYYMTSLLAQNKLPAIVLGTTNLSEGGYLGYFGKASDGMVDVQMISDLYKSEVVRVAKLLDVPEEIINRPPTGDMFDATTDEVVFGAPYDFVELYQETMRNTGKKACPTPIDYQALTQWTEYQYNLDRMHDYNKHKYLGRSPAVHLDIMPCAVKNGWDNTRPSLEKEAGMTQAEFYGIYTEEKMQNPNRNLEDSHKLKHMNGPVLLSGYWPPLDYSTGSPKRYSAPEANFQHLIPGVDQLNLLGERECEMLTNDQAAIHWSYWRPADIYGKKIDADINVGFRDRNMVEHPEYCDKVGSWRATTVNDDLANLLWERIKTYLPVVNVFEDDMDIEGHPVWTPVGVSNTLRFIKYRGYDINNKLHPHYDAPFVLNSRKRTLKSLVVYLNSSYNNEGATRFIKDPQANLPVSQRNLSDWDRPAYEQEVELQISPEMGSAIVFNHRLLHDALPLPLHTQTEKTILRTDIIYERLDTYR